MMHGLQVYKCQVCDSVVEVLDACGVELVCCGPPMALLPEQPAPPGPDQHAIVMRRTAGGVHVTVGSPRHPCARDDRIAWIELLAEGCSLRRFLAPGQRPEVIFNTAAEDLAVRYYCTSHGLWRWPGVVAGTAGAEQLQHVAGLAQ